jgi:hypothetical protein
MFNLCGRGVWMASEEETIGWFLSCFFGFGMIVATIQLLPNASYLLLTAGGLEMRTMYRSSFVSWNEIAFFATASIRYKGMVVRRMVVFNFSENYNKLQIGRRVAKVIAGHEGGLPDTYGMTADQLANLLSEWKNRFEEAVEPPHKSDKL